MRQRRWFVVLTCVALAFLLVAACPAATPTPRPEGKLTVAVATFGKVGEWPLISGHMGLHNWEYVTRAR